MTALAEQTLDDLLRVTLTELIEAGQHVAPTRGANLELRGVRLELTDPRARLSRSKERGRLFSCLGEFLWYLTGSGDSKRVAPYISGYTVEAETDGMVHAAYGTRLLGDEGRVASVIETLRDRPTTRQAVVQLLEPSDLTGEYKHVPCTCTLQFMQRDGQLDMVVFMRSNDVHLGLPHDIFAFTMLQEIVARSLGSEPGTYVHMVGSLHLYDKHREHAQAFLDEGWTSLTAMPPMPPGDPWANIALFTESADNLRENPASETPNSLEPYWADLYRVLAMYNLRRLGSTPDHIDILRKQMTSHVYDVFLNDRFDIIGNATNP